MPWIVVIAERFTAASAARPAKSSSRDQSALAIAF